MASKAKTTRKTANPKAQGHGSVSAPEKLTAKEELFIEHYLQCRNATESMRRAGYEGNDNVLAVSGHRLLRKPKISELIAERTKAIAADANEILSGLARVHRGSLKPFFTTADDGTIWPDLGSEESLENFDLLKKIKIKRRQGGTNEDPWTETEYELELHDPLRAKELLGKYHKLFTDKVEHSGPNEGPIKHEDVGAYRGMDRNELNRGIEQALKAVTGS